jgi:cell division protein FtsB
MTDSIASFFETALPTIEFFVLHVLPVLGMLLLGLGAALALVRFIEVIWAIQFLKADVDYLRKELERHRQELRDLQHKSFK